MENNSTHRYTNLLINESSPYLLDHAHNPVNWYPWGKEALQKAQREDKPLIISIGYAACHWCHVMERESYSDSEVADYMNEHFVAIKIDREERPDIDQIYMECSILINKSGGWPLNAFALPDGRPFYAVTYLPKNNWLNLLRQIVELYTDSKNELQKQANGIKAGIIDRKIIRSTEMRNIANLKETYLRLFNLIEPNIDDLHGGLGSAPKFPMPSAWECLLQYHVLTDHKRVLPAVTNTLTRMATGGIYDQIGGGFARYATDVAWRIPHFEKMLYDNAQLTSLYAHAYQLTNDPLYAHVVHDTLEFVGRELTDPNGGFYSSLNADSEGEEGKFYVWTEDEIKKLLSPEDFELIKDYYHIRADGNWEQGKNILFHKKIGPENKKGFAERHNISQASWDESLKRINSILFKAREKRIRPSTDKKILCSWNALMIKAYVSAYRAFREEKYLDTAIKNADFIKNNLAKEDGSLWRSFMAGKAGIDAMLDDYALLADAYIALYEVTFDKNWLVQADALTQYVLRHFTDAQHHLFYYTAADADNLFMRSMDIDDNVIPSSNSVIAHVLYRLGTFLENVEYLRRARNMVSTVLPMLSSAPAYYGNWGQVLGIMQEGADEIAIMGDKASIRRAELQSHFLPTSLYLGGKKENLPLLEGKLIPGKTIIYVCKNKNCKLPVEDVNQALKQLNN